MNLNNKKVIFLLSTVALVIVVSLLVYQKQHTSLSTTITQKMAKATLQATPLSYKGSTLLNEFNKTTIDNYPTAAGTFDLSTMASQITSQLTQAFSNAAGKPLPLVANWNVGIPEYSDGLDPMYMINRLANGEHIVPTWKLDSYYNDTIGLSYYEASIKKAAELGLPLVFILPSPESALIKDDVYFSMDKNNNPNVITPDGIVLPKLSPFGPNNLWNEVGGQWSTTSLMAQLQVWYPNPPLVLFIDEDSSSKLSWSDLNSSSRYQTQYPLDGTDEFKRTLVNAQWVEKYRQLHKGFKDGFTNDNWKQNSKFISRNQLASNMGTTSDWQKSATTTNLHANIWPLTADGLTVDVALDGNKTLLNNLPFMLDEAKDINPHFVTQLSIDVHQNITDANKYRGYTQMALWLLRPNIIRQMSYEATKADINPLFQEVVDSVELINGSDQLADFWKNGKLVKTGDGKYNTDVPAIYQALPREFFLQTDATSPVYAFAFEKGVAPYREWLIYVQSPEGNLTDVAVTIPEYKDILVDSSNMGNFYVLNENSNDTNANTTLNSEINTTVVHLAPSVNFYVSLDGNDNASGSIEDPFKTLEEARDAARSLKANTVHIFLRGGTYALSKTFELTKEDSRTASTPLIFQAYSDENVTLIGGKIVNNWTDVTDQKILDRLPEVARGHVKVADLKALGLTEYGSPKGGGTELFFNGEPMTLSRWPNKGFTKIEGLVYPGTKVSHDIEGSETGAFYYKGDRPLRWKNDKDIWADGYWFWDWSEEKQAIEKIDYANKIISLKGKHYYGYRDQKPYYVFNLLSELDEPQEWYLDRNTGLLYFWPNKAIKNDTAMVSSLFSILNIADVSYVNFYNINFSASTGVAINIKNVNNVSINDATIKNTGSWGVKIENSSNSGVTSCHISQTGDGGIYLKGGDRKTLTPGNLYATNNEIHDYARIHRTYKPAISLNGVGNIASHNHIYNAPHMAIFFQGNNHVIEYNEINNVLQETNDAGAIYGLRDWSQRGTIIQYNYFHDINSNKHNSSSCIYFDDQLSGMKAIGNIFYKVNRPFLIGGGKDNIISNNIIIDSYQPIYLDNRGLTWSANDQDRLINGLKSMPYTSKIWTSQYPELKNLFNTKLAAPTGNKITNNLFVNIENWDSAIVPNAKQYIILKDNISKTIDINDSSLSSIMNSLVEQTSIYGIPYNKIESN